MSSPGHQPTLWMEGCLHRYSVSSYLFDLWTQYAHFNTVRFIYTLFLCIDANFRQKNRYRATTYEDVSLSDGWAYFVAKEGYMKHVSKFANQEEVPVSFSSFICVYTNMTLVDKYLRRFSSHPSCEFEEDEGFKCLRRCWRDLRPS